MTAGGEELTLEKAIKHAYALLSSLEKSSAAEILLAHVLKVSRTYLHTWPQKKLTAVEYEAFLTLVKKHRQGEPIAYLIGHREFWSLDLCVTPDVLIPRQDTELLIELILEKISSDTAMIADLGTGSGNIALSIAKERPHWVIHATDYSPKALQIAKINAERLKLSNVTFHHGFWCNALPAISFDAIISNPPYISRDDPHLTQTSLPFEPLQALVSDEEGFKDLDLIIEEAKHFLRPGGLLLLEHGFQQAKKVADLYKKAGYTQATTYQDLNQQDRVTIACWMGF